MTHRGGVTLILKLYERSNFIIYFYRLYFRFLDFIKHKFNGKPERENGEHNTFARKMHPQITRKFICFSLGFIQLFHSQIAVCRISLHLLLAATHTRVSHKWKSMHGGIKRF